MDHLEANVILTDKSGTIQYDNSGAITTLGLPDLKTSPNLFKQELIESDFESSQTIRRELSSLNMSNDSL